MGSGIFLPGNELLNPSISNIRQVLARLILGKISKEYWIKSHKAIILYVFPFIVTVQFLTFSKCIIIYNYTLISEIRLLEDSFI